jgi:transposase IS66 family protein
MAPIDFDPNQIEDLEGAQKALVLVLNLVEEVKQENDQFRKIIQKMRDEINRLKGEQGKPDIKPGKKKEQRKEYSSEKERQQPKKWKKGSKLDKIKVDDEKILPVDKSKLPDDAEFKGYEPVIVQDLKIETNNIRFKKEKYYSPSTGKTWIAPLPAGYEGEFGPHVRSLIITLYHGANMSEPKVAEFLSNMGIFISDGQVSNILTKKNELWHTEKDEIYRAGMESSRWQHIDDTSTRVDGENQYCHIVGNPLYTAYFTRPRKDRLTVIKVLQNLPQSQFLLNSHTKQWLKTFNTPKWVCRLTEKWPQNEWLTYEQIEERVTSDLARLGKQQKARVLEAAALTAYHAQTVVPVLEVLMSDDAPQFKWLAEEHALCWIHDGRHYKKLTPHVTYHQKLLADFRGKYWNYYAELEQYRVAPNKADAAQLRQKFNALFSTVTGYNDLDERIAKTKAKQKQLLVVLKYPEIPLHNNPAELGARQRVRKRDVSFGPRTKDGVEAWDTFMTLAETAKKLGVSFYAYIYDRISKSYKLPDLADMIRQQSPAFHPVRTPAPP